MNAWRATVYHTGLVTWEPPTMLKSSCAINIEFFPFDKQARKCTLKSPLSVHITTNISEEQKFFAITLQSLPKFLSMDPQWWPYFSKIS